MADIEADGRQTVVSLLETLCDCHQEAPVALTNNHRGYVDVLCRPHAPELHDLCFAIEVKAKTEIGDAEMAAWFAQCRTYVGAILAGALADEAEMLKETAGHERAFATFSTVCPRREAGTVESPMLVEQWLKLALQTVLPNKPLRGTGHDQGSHRRLMRYVKPNLPQRTFLRLGVN